MDNNKSLCLFLSDVLPDPESFHDDPETANTIFAIKSLIVDSSLLSNITDTLPIEQMQISHLLKTMDLKMGDKVFVAGVKVIIVIITTIIIINSSVLLCN